MSADGVDVVVRPIDVEVDPVETVSLDEGQYSFTEEAIPISSEIYSWERAKRTYAFIPKEA